MIEKKRRLVEELFQQAADLPPGERCVFLDAKCNDDPTVRSEVESLLDCLEDRQIPSLDAVDLVEESNPSIEGRRIGLYKLVRLIGEGGFGSVYMAEQEEPIRRTVALKIIKLGMDTKKVISRFEAERQALAMMDHPSIARVLDAGTTETGRPFFVMELVKGIPITEFADEKNLDLKQRLELFTRVCQAIQHAHQKGIIHRDLKPSNVLVTLHDNAPIPKVIDFGIAKATNKQLKEETFCTDHCYFMGTPEYMSPEQAGLNGNDIDTRTDIYSLGVLLYVLLTGRTPFDWKTLGKATYLEVQRIIREEYPPTPSHRVSQLGPELVKVAQARRLSPQTLSKNMQGDLDWIVMKAMEKDRSRRYATSADLIADIQRYMNHEPVLAGPPSTAYRIAKFVRRHRIGVAATAVTVLALLAGLSLATYGYIQAESARASLKQERDFAETARKEAVTAKKSEQQHRLIAEQNAAAAEREAFKYGSVNDFLQGMLELADPGIAQGREVNMRGVLDEAARKVDEGSLSGQAEAEAAVRVSIGKTYEALGLYRTAESHLRTAVDINARVLGVEARETLESKRLLAGVIERQGFYGEAEKMFREVLAAQERILGDEHPDTLLTMDGLAVSLWRQGDYMEAERIHTKTFETQRRVLGEDHIDTLKSMVHLGTCFWHTNRLDEAETWLGEAYGRERRVLGAQHPETLKVMNNLGLVLRGQGLYKEAEKLLRETVEIQRVVLGYDHPDYVRTLNNLLGVLKIQGKVDEAHDITVQRIEASKALASGSDVSANTLNTQAWFLLTCEPSELQDPETALPIARRAADLSGWENPDILDTLALAYHGTGNLDKAVETQKRAVLFSASEGSVDPAGLEYRFVEYLLEEMGALKVEKILLKPVANLVKKQSSLLKGPGEILFRAGKSLMDKGEYNTAERLLEESLDLRLETLPEDHMHIVASKVYLGAVLAGLKKFEDAEMLLLEAVKTIQSHPEPDNTLEYQAFLKIINMYAAWGKPDKEEAWLNRLQSDE